MDLNLLNLFLVLLAAWSSGWIAVRLGFPAMLGALLAGILLGPPALDILHGSEELAVLAEVGALLMMLYIGMAIDPREIGRASWAGLLAAVGGFAIPFVLAYAVVLGYGGTHLSALFVAIVAGGTSLATRSRTLAHLKLLDTRIAHVLLAGTLVSGLLALAAFAAVIGVVEAGSLRVAGLLAMAVKALLFFATVMVIGLRVLPYVGRRLREATGESAAFHFLLILLVAVAFGALAELAGLHAIFGTFLAGIFLREGVMRHAPGHDLMSSVRHASVGFLAPVFFVTAGFGVSFGLFQSEPGLFASVLGAAVIGKIAGAALLYLPTGNGWAEGLAIGMGMNGRGAVEVIIASIGLQMGLISPNTFSLLIFLALLTTASVPVLLRWSTNRLQDRGALVRSDDERRGTLIIGAGPLARALAQVLGRTRPVWLVDSNPERCAFATSEDLHVVQGDALEEEILSEAHAARADSLITLTSNSEVNSLAARIARNVFHIPEVLMVQTNAAGTGHDAALKHLSASRLFAGPVRQSDWDHWVSHGEIARSKVKVRECPARSAGKVFQHLQRDRTALPLAIKRDGEYLPFHQNCQLYDDDEVIIVYPKLREEMHHVTRDRFDRLVARCPIIDLERSMDLEEFFRLAAVTLRDQAGMDPDELSEALLRREMNASTVIAPGLAVPHVPVKGRERFQLLIARSRDGISFPGQNEQVHAIFLLMSSHDERTFHLRALSAIAQTVQDPAFDERWLTAWSPEDLRRLVLHADRRRYPELTYQM